jgi:hypothetical protein
MPATGRSKTPEFEAQAENVAEDQRNIQRRIDRADKREMMEVTKPSRLARENIRCHPCRSNI